MQRNCYASPHNILDQVSFKIQILSNDDSIQPRESADASPQNHQQVKVLVEVHGIALRHALAVFKEYYGMSNPSSRR